MAGIKKDPGPTGVRLAESLRHIRKGVRDITTAELSRRLTALGQPIPDTSITKAEQGTRRVDVDDLVALAVALGVTPNTLLLPQVGYLGASEAHHLTPAVSGSAEHLWQWAQGETPLHMQIPGSEAWLGEQEHRALWFIIRSRPYLTAPAAPGGGGHGPLPELRELSVAIQKAMQAGATGTEIRRVAELTMTLPDLMTDAEIGAWLEDGTRPREER
jgi:Cro/C1-type HTH DNA-binding domain